MKRLLVWMLILLLVSAALYIAALDFGRPLPEYSPSTVQNAWLNGATVFHPDEFAYAGLAFDMMVHRTLNPQYFHNPSLNIYTDMALFWLTGAQSLPYNIKYGTREIAPFSLYVMARFLSALFSVLTVALAYTTGRLAFNRQVGLLTAALVALSPLSVQHAHYATPNAQTITLSTAALLMAVVILRQQKPTLIVYLLGGLAVGLTMAARYNAVVIGVVTGLAMLTAWWRHRSVTPVIVGLAAIPVGFVIGTPGAVFASAKFLSDVQEILNRYKNTGEGPGWTTTNGLYYHWQYTLLFVVGPVAAVLAVIGLGRLLSRWRARWQDAWIGATLALYLLIYSLSALPGKRINANLLLPLIAPLALLAAYGLVWLWQRFGKWRWIMVGLAIALLIWPAVLSIWFVRLLALPDNRLLAQAWIYQHVPKGTMVHLLASYNVPLDPLDYPFINTYGWAADPKSPPWDAPIIVYSDSAAFTALRAPNLSDNPADLADLQATRQKLQAAWIELARFPRRYWPGQNTPPDDVSYWHQMEITIYCNPTRCPVQR